MMSDVAREMLLPVFRNTNKKIIAAFKSDAVLTRTEVAERSGYAAGSGGINNLVGN